MNNTKKKKQSHQKNFTQIWLIAVNNNNNNNNNSNNNNKKNKNKNNWNLV